MLLYEIQKYVKEKCICTAAATGDWATASSYDKTHTVVWTTSSGMEGPPVPAVGKDDQSIRHREYFHFPVVTLHKMYHL
jgi:hypothetical protein